MQQPAPSLPSIRSVTPFRDDYEMQSIASRRSSGANSIPPSLYSVVSGSINVASNTATVSPPLQHSPTQHSLTSRFATIPIVNTATNATPSTPFITPAAPTGPSSSTVAGSSTTSPKPVHRSSWLKRWWYHGWVAEICSCFLAVVSLVAIALTLHFRQNDLLPQWPLHITINALISVFVVLLKAGIALPISEGSVPAVEYYAVRLG